MATYLYRLGGTAYRRWPLFIAAWVIVLVVVGVLASAFSRPASDRFAVDGIASSQATRLQSELFPDAPDPIDLANFDVVVAVPEGQRLDDPRYADRIASLIADLADGPQLPAQLTDPRSQAALNPVAALATPPTDESLATFAPVSADGRIGVITLAFDVDTVTDVDQASQDAVLDAIGAARGDGLSVEANGPGMQTFSPPGGAAELIGVGVAVVVLILTFGSLAAAGMPLLLALFGVGLGIASVGALSSFVDFNSAATVLASMIGLAVGIDYSLFILARYRDELERTPDREVAVGLAVGTAGSAVVFAGLTVVIALAALAVVGIPVLTKIGIAASLAVLIAVLAALTLLPAVLGVVKSKAFGGRVRRYRPTRDDEGRVLNNGVRWARSVARRPVAAVLLAVVTLGALALPLADLELGFPSDSTAPTDTTQRRASDLVTEGFGPGREAPFQLVVDGRDLDDAARAEAFSAVLDWARQQEGVKAVVDLVALTGAAAGSGAERSTPEGIQLILVPEHGPSDSRTSDLLTSLRAGEAAIEAETGTQLGITGLTAVNTDVADLLSGAMPIYLAVIVGLAFILLMLVFRSVLVPLTATLGYLFSVLATLGSATAVFQGGALGLVPAQPIPSIVPIFIIGVSFGLAMDYQVFLVTRMREARLHGYSASDAVVDGFRSSARVVVAAAVIMVAVFSGFMAEPDSITKLFGFSLACAVVLDAFVVRLLLVPALMFLLGDRSWYLPAWLDRLLPVIDVEGERLERPAAAAPAPEPDLVT